MFQLRYLQTLSTISAEHNSTIIFPMPINILDQFLRRYNWSSRIGDGTMYPLTKRP